VRKLTIVLPVLILLALLLLWGACSPRKLPALGGSENLTIVTNLSPTSEAVELVKTLFSKKLVTIEEEARYKIEMVGPENLHKQRDSRNLLLLADLSKRDRVSGKVREVLGKKELEQLVERGAGYAVLSNVEALGQTMAVVAGTSGQALMNVLREKGEELYAETDSLVTVRTQDLMYIHGEDTSMERYILSKYGWSVKIPKTFRVAEEEEGRVIKIVSAEDPARLFLVHWTASASDTLSKKECLGLRAKLAWAYYDEDKIDQQRTTSREVMFQGRKALKLSGVWQNDKYVIGGPFITYCFLEKGRLYLLDGVVFAPGMNKGPWLRQVEAMMLTFSDNR